MAMRSTNYRFSETSVNMAEAHSFCSRFMPTSAMLIEDAIIVASIFVVLLTVALFVRAFMMVVLVLLVAVALIISCDNLIARRKMSEPRG